MGIREYCWKACLEEDDACGSLEVHEAP